MTVRACPLLPSGVLVAMLAAMVATLLPLTALSAPPRYIAERLGTLGGNSSRSTSINDRGDVVGSSSLAGDAAFRGFVHANGTLIDIGVAGNDACSAANDINDDKQVVGFSDFACEGNQRPSIYADGTHTYLFGFFVFGQATSINASGQITGWTGASGENRAFFLSAGSVTHLGTLGGRDSYGYGLNDRGDIVGESATMLPGPTSPNVPRHAFLYAGTMRDLGTLGGNYSVAYAINNSGQVTGWSNTAGDRERHAYVHTAGVMLDLGTLGGAFSEGTGINDAGWVVGRSSTASGPERGFLYVDGSMYDLNELLVSDLAGDEIAYPQSINSRGQIAAAACSPNRDRCVALRLDPVADQRTTEVPVLSPAMLGAIAIALGSAGAWRLRRKRAR